MELHEYIAKKLSAVNQDQIDCIENILNNSMVLNEFRTGTLSEKKLDMIVKLTGSYLGELFELLEHPDQYEEKLGKIKEQMGTIA